MRGAPVLLLAAAFVAGCATAPPPLPAPEPPAEPAPAPPPIPAPPPKEPAPAVTIDRAPEIDPALIPMLIELGITAPMIAAKRLQQVPEATELVVVQVDADGRRHELTPAAADAFRRMQAAAATDGVVFTVASAFRSVARQVEIVRRKLDRGERIEDILLLSAPPGFSEHHSGNVVDLSTPGSESLEADFAATPAYAWLTAHAARFGFELSYPENNPEGYAFEPWHWRFIPGSE